jgi:hypothetical protein
MSKIMRRKLSKLFLTALFLCLLICQPCWAQTDEDWDWVNDHFGSVLEELLPIEQRLGMNIGFRSHRDLYTNVLEYSFLLTYDYPTNKVSAVVRAADSVSLYDQLMTLHRKNPTESIDNLKKQLKIKESHFTDVECPALRTLFFQYNKIRFHAPSLQLIILHPMIYEIKSGVAAGDMYLSFVEEHQPLVAWALRVKRALNASGTSSGRQRSNQR